MRTLKPAKSTSRRMRAPAVLAALALLTAPALALGPSAPPGAAGDSAAALAAAEAMAGLAPGSPPSEALRLAARAAGVDAVPSAAARTSEAGLVAAVAALHARLGAPLADAEAQALRAQAASLPPGLDAALGGLVMDLLAADGRAAAALAGIPPDAWATLEARCPRGPDLDLPAECAAAAARVVAGLDRDALAGAALDAMLALEAARPAIEAAAAHPAAATAAFADPLGLVRVAGSGADLHLFPDPSPAAPEPLLVLDLGGDDTYLGAAGGVVGDLPRIGAALDVVGVPDRHVNYVWGSLLGVVVDTAGNDYYDNPSGQGFQAGARLGAAILLEGGGDDTYVASSMAQGAGDTGVAVLADLAGRDTYTANYRSQGYGSFGGLGLLLDQGGDDAMRGALLVQGAGYNLGAGGVLLALGGNDGYWAITWGTTASQGASFGGGAGIFIDSGGADPGISDGYQNSFGARGFHDDRGAGAAVFVERGGLDSYANAPGANGQSWTQGFAGYAIDRNA